MGEKLRGNTPLFYYDENNDRFMSIGILDDGAVSLYGDDIVDPDHCELSEFNVYNSYEFKLKLSWWDRIRLWWMLRKGERYAEGKEGDKA